jgi:putative ABC transport system substrate-binding protein
MVPVVAAHAQKPAPCVASVYLFKEGPTAPFLEAFRDRMHELGWIDGQNVHIEPTDALGRQDKLAAIMRELVDEQVDVIVAMCTPEAKVARRVTRTIPIVMAATGDPVAAGRVPSMSRPGGNTLRTADQLAAELEVLPVGATQGLLNAGDPSIGGQVARLVAFAAARQLPALFEERSFVINLRTAAHSASPFRKACCFVPTRTFGKHCVSPCKPVEAHAVVEGAMPSTETSLAELHSSRMAFRP